MKSARLYASLLEPTSTTEGFQCYFAEGARERLERLGLSSPHGILRAERGDCVRAAPGRRTWRIRDTDDGAEFFLKQYAPGSGRFGKIARFRTPARLEAERLLALSQLGLPVPPLVFACWERGGGPGASGVTVQRAVPGHGLDELMKAASVEACERALLRDVLPILVGLHAAGYFHRDFYSGHLLAERLGAPVSLIDVARARRGAGPGQRLRVKDLAAALASFYDRVRRPSLVRAFLGYCRDVDLPLRWRGRNGRRRLAQAVVRKARRIRRHAPRHDDPGFGPPF